MVHFPKSPVHNIHSAVMRRRAVNDYMVQPSHACALATCTLQHTWSAAHCYHGMYALQAESNIYNARQIDIRASVRALILVHFFGLPPGQSSRRCCATPCAWAQLLHAAENVMMRRSRLCKPKHTPYRLKPDLRDIRTFVYRKHHNRATFRNFIT